MLPRSLPTPSLYLPDRGEPALRWGIIGGGWIARFFADALHAHTTQRITAVSTRSRETAEAFAAEHGIARAYDSADQLVADPGIDVVYIAAPQKDHLALGLLAIAAGKHVLIEKPLATNAADAQRLIDAARVAGVFLMEAMWSRYLPQFVAIRELIADGVLGEVLSVSADHGQAMEPGHRLFQAGTGGGALLDLGIYPIQLDSMVLGAPESVTAVGALADSGVDATSTVVLRHGAEQSTLTTSLLTRTPTVAAINGTAARVEIAGPFHIPTSFVVRTPDLFEEPLMWSDDTGVTLMEGLAWEATALAGFIGEGRVESPVHTHAETVSILATIDEARRQLGAL